MTPRRTSRRPAGVLALVGGGEFDASCTDLDRELVAAAGTGEVVVLPTAAAFEDVDAVVERARQHFAPLGASVRDLRVLNRRDAEDPSVLGSVESARFFYISDGSPLHLRSVLKDSALFAALLGAYERGAVLAASGAGATLLGDPMVDPRGGAYTVGLGVARNLALFPYHGTAADHLRDRSIDLLPKGVVLAGLDERTALVRAPDGTWHVSGPGAVTLYRDGAATRYTAGAVGDLTV